eukprot:4777858-Pleurochrysis_carterae.AAC.3
MSKAEQVTAFANNLRHSFTSLSANHWKCPPHHPMLPEAFSTIRIFPETENKYELEPCTTSKRMHDLPFLCARLSARACVRACVRACMRACVNACVRECVNA